MALLACTASGIIRRVDPDRARPRSRADASARALPASRSIRGTVPERASPGIGEWSLVLRAMRPARRASPRAESQDHEGRGAKGGRIVRAELPRVLTARWRAALVIVAGIGFSASCSSSDDSESRTPVSVHVEASTEGSAVAIDLGPPRDSGIENLPVPRLAQLADESATCTDPNCIEEYWEVRNVSSGAVRGWYADLLDETEPWHDWRPCATEDLGEQAPSVYQWAKADRGLQLEVHERSGNTIIHVRSEPADLPCN